MRPSGIFSQSNFTNYTESRYGSLLVTKPRHMGGRDADDDDSYYRIRLKLQSQNGANEAALRFAILQVPGIQDVFFEAAAGTFTCYVYGVASDCSAALLQNVQQADGLKINDLSPIEAPGQTSATKDHHAPRALHRPDCA